MTDAVKMAIEALRWIVEREKSASSAAALEMARAATDALDKIAALEQAGEPVDENDSALLARLIDASREDMVDIVMTLNRGVRYLKRKYGKPNPALSTPTPAQVEPLSVADAWQDLVHKSDRTSPEEYPDMALITREELADYMQSAQSRGQAFDGEGEELKPLLPPAAVESGDYLEGWMDGQTYLILAHGGTAALSSAKRGEA